MPQPLAPRQAVEIVDEWLALPSVHILEPGLRYWPTLREMVTALGVNGNLAALAIEHDATVCTTDRDFDRFEGLRLFNPLA